MIIKYGIDNKRNTTESVYSAGSTAKSQDTEALTSSIDNDDDDWLGVKKSSPKKLAKKTTSDLFSTPSIPTDRLV